MREQARASREYLAGLVGTNTVRVEVTLTNELKVFLGTVYCGGTNVNAAVVAAAHGEFRREFLAGSSFRARYALLQAEQEALAAERRP